MRRLVIPALIGGLCLLASLGLVRSCGWTEPVTFPDYQAKYEASERQRVADSAQHADTVRVLAISRDSALRVAGTAKAEAIRWRAIRSAAHRDRKEKPPTISYGIDSTPTVPKADYDTLAAEADSLWSVVQADSVALVKAADIIRADSIAYASLASLLADERAQFGRERAQLRQMVTKARRSGCFLGIPTPRTVLGYGVTVTEGRVAHGPTLAIAIPLRGC